MILHPCLKKDKFQVRFEYIYQEMIRITIWFVYRIYRVSTKSSPDISGITIIIDYIAL
jgi:hypothetical protein